MKQTATHPGSTLTWPWRAAGRWLSNVPIADPVDRRNAPMLQIVLIVLGVVPPLLWLYRVLAADIPWRPGETASLVMSLSLSAIAIFSLVLVRRGRFRWAATQLLAVALLLMVLSYAQNGFARQAYEQPVQVIWLVVAGLVLGRRALWWTFAVHMLAFGIGLAADASEPDYGSPANAYVSALISAVILLLIAVVVDRSVAALRESLGEANRRSGELAALNERLQAEIAERERVHEQLVHARKVEAVGRLASGVAHDFNHLLTLVLGYLKQGRRSDDPDAMRQSIQGAESAAQRAAAVAQTLLNFGRHSPYRHEVFDAGQALREMQPMLRQLFDPSVALQAEAPSAPHPIGFDRDRFALVVLNLAANAQQAMPEGGQFRIGVRRVDGHVEMTFADTGHGMSEDVRTRIFEPFFTTKPRGQGTGLGLSVAAGVVAEGGGHIDVDSAPGRGTTFRVRFPLATKAAADEGSDARPARPADQERA